MIDVDEYVFMATRPSNIWFRPTEFTVFLDRLEEKRRSVLQLARFDMSSSGVVTPDGRSQPDAFVERKIVYEPNSSPKAIAMIGKFDHERASQHNLFPLHGWCDRARRD